MVVLKLTIKQFSNKTIEKNTVQAA